ncbi:MAG: hypothetical protein P1U80_01225 [Pseudomonadales bacterium]|jgi:hypothetical protein|nr:hypothetical protein [Pseudomonadales bacterium]
MKGLVENQFDGIRIAMQSAQDNEDYELIAKLDKQIHNELLNIDMKQLASNPRQVTQLTDLLDWYRAAIESFTAQQSSLLAEINGRAKNKKAVGCYQSMASGA